MWYRWKILVREAIIGSIRQESGDRTFNFKFHARAGNIKVKEFELGYDVNDNDVIDGGEIDKVRPFYKDGTVNPLYSVRHPNPTDCIDIDFELKKDHFDKVGETKVLELGEKMPREELKKIFENLRKPKSGIQFCAGSCSGYMLAASNGG